MFKLEHVGDLLLGIHEGEIFIITEDGICHDISQELEDLDQGLAAWKKPSERVRVRLLIEEIRGE